MMTIPALNVIGMLASLGMIKGQPFNPDAHLKDILSRAVVEAPRQIMAFRMNSAMLRGLAYYKDRQYVNVWTGVDADFNTPTYLAVDQRAAYFQVAYSSAPAMVNDTVGMGSKYPSTFKDADGDFLVGGKQYKLHLPPNIPAALYWAALPTIRSTEQCLRPRNPSRRAMPSTTSRSTTILRLISTSVPRSPQQRRTRTGFRPCLTMASLSPFGYTCRSRVLRPNLEARRSCESEVTHCNSAMF